MCNEKKVTFMTRDGRQAFATVRTAEDAFWLFGNWRAPFIVEERTYVPGDWRGREAIERLFDSSYELYVDAQSAGPERDDTNEPSDRFCPKCEQAWAVHNDDGSCIQDKEQLAEKPNRAGLLPYPHCGETEDLCILPKRYHGGAVEINGLKFWRVECLPCDARTGDFFDGDYDNDGRRAAITAWNRRRKETGNE